MRKLFLTLTLTLASTVSAVTVDRIAAVIDQQVLTVTEIGQMVELRFFERQPGQSDDDYRRATLDALIAQALRRRDVERFGAPSVPPEAIETRLLEIQNRLGGPVELEAALVRAELSMDELQALVTRQLQVEQYIQERFAPLIYVSPEEIETFYSGAWTQQRRQGGLAVAPLDQASAEIRDVLRGRRLLEEIERWTNRLRLRADVDVYAWR